MGRRLRDKLPATSQLLRPSGNLQAREDLVSRQQRYKYYYDRQTRAHHHHAVGDHVRVRRGRTWDRATITARHGTPRSYVVTMEDGTVLRRNQRFINKSPDPVREQTRDATYPDAGVANTPVRNSAVVVSANSGPVMPTTPTSPVVPTAQGSTPTAAPYVRAASPRRSGRDREPPKWQQDT